MVSHVQPKWIDPFWRQNECCLVNHDEWTAEDHVWRTQLELPPQGIHRPWPALCLWERGRSYWNMLSWGGVIKLVSGRLVKWWEAEKLLRQQSSRPWRPEAESSSISWKEGGSQKPAQRVSQIGWSKEASVQDPGSTRVKADWPCLLFHPSVYRAQLTCIRNRMKAGACKTG